MAEHLYGSAKNELIISLLSFGGMAISIRFLKKNAYSLVIL